ncbi:hypothetical protein GQ53DRAFT_375951 [Thozetella sp. PMI_491]|nr:hypothetical protein GQ53DRAFT_375951 [Thozetella sp. PMI_491]
MPRRLPPMCFAGSLTVRGEMGSQHHPFLIPSIPRSCAHLLSKACYLFYFSHWLLLADGWKRGRKGSKRNVYRESFDWTLYSS